MPTTIQTGIENLIENPRKWISGERIGILCNPASVNHHFTHTRLLVDRVFPGQLTALYSPQHGFFAEKQDNMIESGDMLDPDLNIPVFSLYGETRVPNDRMFESIDILLVDLQDVGTRVYTFIYTLSYCLESARKFNIKVIILDRPNPIDGVTIEGNCLAANCESFVGRYPIPMRHGLTVGEVGRLFNEHFKIGCELDVVPMQGWDRNMMFGDTGLPWIAPSPNLPTPASTLVYPGQVIWEGTNVSEGRGTALPFELFGAPFMDTAKMQATLDKARIPGVVLRPAVFEPTSNKWQQTACSGFQLHVTDPRQYRPYATSLHLLQASVKHHRKEFEWKSPPYEYEFERMPIDLIIGDRTIRRRIENLEPLAEIEASWEEGLEEYKEISKEFRLYK